MCVVFAVGGGILGFIVSPLVAVAIGTILQIMWCGLLVKLSMTSHESNLFFGIPTAAAIPCYVVCTLALYRFAGKRRNCSRNTVGYAYIAGGALMCLAAVPMIVMEGDDAEIIVLTILFFATPPILLITLFWLATKPEPPAATVENVPTQENPETGPETPPDSRPRFPND